MPLLLHLVGHRQNLLCQNSEKLLGVSPSSLKSCGISRIHFHVECQGKYEGWYDDKTYNFRVAILDLNKLTFANKETNPAQVRPTTLTLGGDTFAREIGDTFQINTSEALPLEQYQELRSTLPKVMQKISGSVDDVFMLASGQMFKIPQVQSMYRGFQEMTQTSSSKIGNCHIVVVFENGEQLGIQIAKYDDKTFTRANLLSPHEKLK